MDNITQVLRARSLSKYKKSFSKSYIAGSPIIFTSSCDKGVQRNGGRLGARFAPKCILNELGKFE